MRVANLELLSDPIPLGHKHLPGQAGNPSLLSSNIYDKARPCCCQSDDGPGSVLVGRRRIRRIFLLSTLQLHLEPWAARQL